MNRGWIKLDEGELDRLWYSFEDAFDFRPSGGTPVPVIRDPSPSITFDLRSIWSPDAPAFGAAASASIDASARRCFLREFGDDIELTVLDWQHVGYRYRPGLSDVTTDPGAGYPMVVPDGDYWIYLVADQSEGTFGHPWEPSLCVFGPRMTRSLGSELATWLPVLRRVDA